MKKVWSISELGSFEKKIKNALGRQMNDNWGAEAKEKKGVQYVKACRA